VKFGICYQHFAAIKRHRGVEREEKRERERKRECGEENEGRAKGREKELSLDNNRFYGCSCGEP